MTEHHNQLTLLFHRARATGQSQRACPYLPSGDRRALDATTACLSHATCLAAVGYLSAHSARKAPICCWGGSFRPLRSGLSDASSMASFDLRQRIDQLAHLLPYLDSSLEETWVCPLGRPAVNRVPRRRRRANYAAIAAPSKRV
eukprot:542944-Pyramimonas_sp.AAC.1